MRWIILLMALIILESCDQKNNYEIEINDDKLIQVIKNLEIQNNQEKIDKDIRGLYMLETSDFCPFNKGILHNIIGVNHPLTLEDYHIFGYTLIENILILHYDESIYTPFDTMPYAELKSLYSPYLYDIHDIPNSGGGQEIFYNSKLPVDQIFNYRDTFYIYDGKETERKLGAYMDYYCFD